MRLGPWNPKSICREAPGRRLKNRGSSAGQNLARGLTGCWGKVVGKHQGIERNSWVALVGAGKAGGGSPARNKGPAVMSNGGDGAPVALDGGNRAWEDKWWPRKLAKGSVWGEEGRRRRLGGGGHGVVAPLRVKGDAVVRPGSFTGRGGCYLGAGLWRRRGRSRGSAARSRGMRPWRTAALLGPGSGGVRLCGAEEWRWRPSAS